MTNKMTYVMALDNAMAVVTDTATLEKLEALKASLEKKHGSAKKPTATQQANVGLREAIVAFMAEGEKYTVTDMMKQCEALADMSNQKVSALVRQLIADNKVVRETVKGKAYFSLA